MKRLKATVRTLFNLGASCDIQDANGKTVLLVSVEMGSLEVTKFIVESQEMFCGEAELNYIVTLNRAVTKLNQLNIHDKDRDFIAPFCSSRKYQHSAIPKCQQ